MKKSTNFKKRLVHCVKTDLADVGIVQSCVNLIQDKEGSRFVATTKQEVFTLIIVQEKLNTYF